MFANFPCFSTSAATPGGLALLQLGARDARYASVVLCGLWNPCSAAELWPDRDLEIHRSGICFVLLNGGGEKKTPGGFQLVMGVPQNSWLVSGKIPI